MEAVLREYGPGWQKQSLERLKKARSAKLKALKEKPKVKKGETPPPAKTQEEIDGELASYMEQQRCLEDTRTANWLEGFKVGWMVARREEVDFDTLQQKGVKSLPSNFVAPAMCQKMICSTFRANCRRLPRCPVWRLKS